LRDIRLMEAILASGYRWYSNTASIPIMSETTPRRGLAIGCGGTLGFARSALPARVEQAVAARTEVPA